MPAFTALHMQLEQQGIKTARMVCNKKQNKTEEIIQQRHIRRECMMRVLSATLPTQKPLNGMFIFLAVSGKSKFLEVGLDSSRVWRPRILASWFPQTTSCEFPYFVVEVSLKSPGMVGTPSIRKEIRHQETRVL